MHMMAILSCGATILVAALLVQLANCGQDDTQEREKGGRGARANEPADPRWPGGRLNVLVDERSVNASERQILRAFFEQLELKTCLRVNQMSANKVNPFDPNQHLYLSEFERNYVYIFKSHFNAHNREPSMGLSTLGCTRQGRQSLVLTELAFRWPELVLRYHLLRTLGLGGLQKPDKQVDQLTRPLPLSQKIDGDEPEAVVERVAVGARRVEGAPANYLDAQDVFLLKRLYDCPDYQNKLSPGPPPSSTPSLDERLEMRLDRLNRAEDTMRKVIKEADRTSQLNDSLVDEAAKSIVEYLTADQPPPATGDAPELEVPQFEPQPECRPLETCPIGPREPKRLDERPMLLKLDTANARDPQLWQADQMRLSSNDSHRLLDTPASKRNSLLISFEQQGNPLPAPSGKPQVLKLCSCTCQTMVPEPASSTEVPIPPTTTWAPSTNWPTTDEAPETTTLPQPSTTEPSVTEPATTEPSVTEPSTTEPTSASQTTTGEPPSTEPTRDWTTGATDSSSPASTLAPTEPTTPTTGPPSSEASTEEGGGGSSTLATADTCDQVSWVRPNKTVYASAKIVWDMDRANQNYFVCQNELNNELLPGKTHGFACKVSQLGKAFELHQFKVLTKPESVNLAWIEHRSDSFGKTNLPVVGGFSASGDPYIVGRCLVRDENNDVITLIGYVNTLGTAWFPFDDIQIECDHYDILSCVA